MRWPAVLALACAAAVPGQATAASAGQAPVISCIQSAAATYRLPPAVIVILLSVEGGTLGRVSQNTNGSVDIGPMQVNSVWLPVIARHWQATVADTYLALRDSFCANVEAGSWILRQAIDSANGNFWSGVGFYHSHDPDLKADYLREVLRQTLRLAAEAQHTNGHSSAAGG